jgi:Ca2+-binding RTX toxin-like protein
VEVNLPMHFATRVAALSNVENATGGSGDDILVGDANPNVLKGLAGRDVIIGGNGADQLFGGADEDLMIAGSTDFGTSLATLPELDTILNTWAGKGKIQDRVNKLKIGVDGVQLNDNTVHVSGTADDAARDQLFSDDDGPPGSPNRPDWFWANKGTLATQDDLTLLTGDIFK